MAPLIPLVELAVPGVVDEQVVVLRQPLAQRVQRREDLVAAGVDQEFFANTTIKSNFICGLGYGDPSGVFARSPRLSFDEACQVV